jgi:hypothetical protein
MPDNPQLSAFIDQLASATASGNTQQFQEMIHEFNLNYANSVAQLYSQNWGPGNPAPVGATTLAGGQAMGNIGYIPGFTGTTAGQTLNQVQGAASTAQNAAGLTGFYAAPSQSEFTPGTFVRLDPSTYDTQQYGDVQMSYVLPSGQLQRVSQQQARAMGWNGDLGTMPITTAQHALQLERAPPQQLPQQTLQGLTTYSNLNTAAQNAAIAQSGVTGYYATPQQVLPPGTAKNGAKFSDLDPQTQQNYYLSRGSDWQAAQAGWVQDMNKAVDQAVTAAGGTPTQPGQAQGPGQMTTQYQEQLYRQQLDAINAAANLQANPFRQQQVIGQLGRVLGGQGVAGFSAPNTVAGVGTAGGTGPNTGMAYMQQLISDIRGGPDSANSVGVQDVLNAVPTPAKLNSVEFLRSAPSTQNMILQAQQERYGLDPADSLQQIKNTMPQAAFQSPQTFGQIKG